jgi:hypothetical protein
MIVFEGVDLFLDRPSEISCCAGAIKRRMMLTTGAADKCVLKSAFSWIPTDGTDACAIEKRERANALPAPITIFPVSWRLTPGAEPWIDPIKDFLNVTHRTFID